MYKHHLVLSLKVYVWRKKASNSWYESHILDRIWLEFKHVFIIGDNYCIISRFCINQLKLS